MSCIEQVPLTSYHFSTEQMASKIELFEINEKKLSVSMYDSMETIERVTTTSHSWIGNDKQSKNLSTIFKNELFESPNQMDLFHIQRTQFLCQFCGKN